MYAENEEGGLRVMACSVTSGCALFSLKFIYALGILQQCVSHIMFKIGNLIDGTEN
jgi:hypothetical protein